MIRASRLLPLAAAILALAGFGALRAEGPIAVDVELVIAVDISYSMDYDEQALQREGYMDAITSREFLEALRKGVHGKIAVTYVEWAGSTDQQVVLPWQIIDGPESAAAIVAKLKNTPIRRAYRTSISGALNFSAALFKDSGFRGLRRVIDVSGDGTNNQGDLIEPTRDAVVAQGITINGLPIMLKEPVISMIDIPNLDIYYEDCVVGGPGAFVVPARSREQFPDAIRKKLVLEVAGVAPYSPRMLPDEGPVIPAASPPRISCTIGERMWQERWGR
ncbi:MAG TPA: DUF1194 domain-containing protein [Xanthobacteraceae bacterium]|nr:DUF1194 domain-containing protein [Xanthobacteraceae bacterium]